MSMTGAGCGIDVAAHSLPAPTKCMRAVPSGPPRWRWLHLVFTWGPRPRAGRSWGRAILIREFVAACFSKVLRCRPFLLLQDRDETSERQPDRHKELKVRRPRPARGRAAVIIYKFMLRTVPHATRLHRVSGLSPGPRPTGQSLISRSRPALTPPPALRPVPPQKTRAFPVST